MHRLTRASSPEWRCCPVSNVCQRVDELLDDAAAASDPAERDYYLREAQQFLYVLVEEAESR